MLLKKRGAMNCVLVGQERLRMRAILNDKIDKKKASYELCFGRSGKVNHIFFFFKGYE